MARGELLRHLHLHLCTKHLPELSSLQVDHEQQYMQAQVTLWAVCQLPTQYSVRCRQKPTLADMEGSVLPDLFFQVYVMRAPTSCFLFPAPAPSSLPSFPLSLLPSLHRYWLGVYSVQMLYRALGNPLVKKIDIETEASTINK